MKKFVVMLICLLTTFFASAQATFLKGSVLEKEAGNFPGVMVTIESDGQKISAQTDIDGVF